MKIGLSIKPNFVSKDLIIFSVDVTSFAEKAFKNLILVFPLKDS